MSNTLSPAVTVVDANQLQAQLDRIEKALSERSTTPPPAIEIDGYMTRKDVCAHFSISTTTLHTWIRKDILKPYKIGNKTLFKRSEIAEAPTSVSTSYRG